MNFNSIQPIPGIRQQISMKKEQPSNLTVKYMLGYWNQLQDCFLNCHYSQKIDFLIKAGVINYLNESKANKLTYKELACVALYLDGYSNCEISKKLMISVRTVEWHFEKLKGKLGIKTKREIIKRFLKFDWINLLNLLSKIVNKREIATNCDNNN